MIQPGVMGHSSYQVGGSQAGLVSNLSVAYTGNDAIITWDYELLPGWNVGGVATYVYLNGQHHATVTDMSLAYRFQPGDTKVILEFFVFPASSAFEFYPYALNHKNRIKIDYDYTGKAKAAELFVSKNASASVPVKVYDRTEFVSGIVYGSISNTELKVLSWTGELSDVATIALTTTATIGNYTYASYAYTLNGVLSNGSVVIQENAPFTVGSCQMVIENRDTLANNDVFTIQLEMPKTYTTRGLSDGDWLSKVAIRSYANERFYSSQGTTTIDLPPAPPSHRKTEVTGGVATLEYSTSEGVFYALYKAFSGETWMPPIPTETGVIAASPFEVEFPVSDGEHWVDVRVMDSSGLWSQEYKPVYLFVSSGEDSTSAANKPVGIKAYLIGGELKVQVTCDNTVDIVNLYHDARTGTIDYETIVDSDTVSTSGKYKTVTFTLSVLTTGTYIFGARASKLGVEEQNTDVTATLYVDLSDISGVTVTRTLV